MTYHSALHEPDEFPPRRRVRLGGSVAFVSDLTDGLHPAFTSCDVLYVEPPWPRLYGVFATRASVPDDVRPFVSALVRVCESATVPTVVVAGQTLIRHLPAPLERYGSRIDSGGRAIADSQVVVYGKTLSLPRPDRTSWILRHLAGRFDHVGDPCCGYGNTGRVFWLAGKRFTMTDVNPECIGAIAVLSKDWKREGSQRVH